MNKYIIQNYYDKFSEEVKSVIEAEITRINNQRKTENLLKRKSELVSLKEPSVVDDKIAEIDAQINELEDEDVKLDDSLRL